MAGFKLGEEVMQFIREEIAAAISGGTRSRGGSSFWAGIDPPLKDDTAPKTDWYRRDEDVALRDAVPPKKVCTFQLKIDADELKSRTRDEIRSVLRGEGVELLMETFTDAAELQTTLDQATTASRGGFLDGGASCERNGRGEVSCRAEVRFGKTF